MTTPDRTLLRLRGWSLSRQSSDGPVALLEEIDLDLVAGRWLAVLGANGSGKSSLLKYLASDESPLAASRGIMFQDPDDQIIAATTAAELTLGHRDFQALPVLEAYGLAGLGQMDPRLLSAGQKQRLVLAVALSGHPDVLFCDEPTALQDDRQAGWILDRLRDFRDRRGGTLVTATCDRREAAQADEIMVLENGRVVAQGPAAQLRDDPRVTALLGGQSVATVEPESIRLPSDRRGHPLLDLQGVGFHGQGVWPGLAGLDFVLHPGDRLGLTGPNGCGKSTLLAACVGARRPDQGHIRLAEDPLYQGSGPDLNHGRALLAPQFPEYIFTRSTVAAELRLDPGLDHLEPADFLQQVGLDPHLAHRNPHSLSSGQKRRLALGLVLFSGRKVLLLDEPTAALDRAGRALVREMIRRVPADSVLVIASHDTAFLAEIGIPCLDLGSFAP